MFIPKQAAGCVPIHDLVVGALQKKLGVQLILGRILRKERWTTARYCGHITSWQFAGPELWPRISKWPD